ASPLAGIVAGRGGGRQGGPAAPAPRRARTGASLTPSDRPAGWLARGEGKPMKISKERRERWEQLTKNDAFNQWLGPQVTAPDGTLDLDRLHAVALKYGIDRREQYAHLNPGQQRMNLGNMLRKAVPRDVYDGDMPATSAPAITTAAPTEPRSEALGRATVRELLRLHAEVLDELRRREVVRTSNSPVGDYAELLFATAFGWELENSSAAGHDATD